MARQRLVKPEFFQHHMQALHRAHRASGRDGTPWLSAILALGREALDDFGRFKLAVRLDGEAAGRQEGYAQGYADGFAAGQAAKAPKRTTAERYVDALLRSA